MTNGRLFMKKKSKRISTRQRKKAEKKVREHHKKVRRGVISTKTSKSGRITKPSSKKLSIPNECPFKAKILSDIEQLKKLREEEFAKRKLGKNDTLPTVTKMEPTKSRPVTSKNCENFKIQPFESVIKKCKIVLHVIDCRNPIESLANNAINSEVDRQGDGHKYTVIVLTKVDLIPVKVFQSWLSFFRQKVNHRTIFISNSVDLRSKRCLGIDSLFYCLQSLVTSESLNTKSPIRVGLTGCFGVGKRSTLRSILTNMPNVRSDFEFITDIGLYIPENGVFSNSIIGGEISSHPNEIDSEWILNQASLIFKMCNRDNLLQLRYMLPSFDNDCQLFLIQFYTKVVEGRDHDIFVQSCEEGDECKKVVAAQFFIRDWLTDKIKFYVAECDKSDLTLLKDRKENCDDVFLKKLSSVENTDLRQLSDKKISDSNFIVI